MSLAAPDPQPDVDAVPTISAAEARFERWRKVVGAVCAPIAFAATLHLTSGLPTPQGRHLAAVLAAVAVLWATEALPLPVTALLGVVLCIVLDVSDAKAALAPFADPIVFLFIGSFILARAMALHRLDRRIALGFLALRWIGGSPARVLAGLGAITALVSMWVSNTATTAMMLPVAVGIVQVLQRLRGEAGKPGAGNWPFATGIMLMVAYAASIGGIGTPVGSPPNLIGIGLIRKLAHVELSFFGWMAIALPMLAVMGLVLYGLLYAMHRPGPLRTEAAADLREYLRRERAALGNWTPGQINTLLAFGVAITLWVLPGVLALVLAKGHPLLTGWESRMPEGVVALLAASLLFVLPVNLRQGQFTISWDEAAKIDWGTILLFGGGLSLGTLMFNTGVAESLGRGVSQLTGADSLWTITAASIAMGIVISEATSNTAAANMIIPVAISLAQAAQVNPVPPALGACFGASFGFMLPVSTPPNAIVYSSRLIPITSMIRAGVLFDLCGFVIILGCLRVLCPLMGFA